MAFTKEIKTIRKIYHMEYGKFFQGGFNRLPSEPSPFDPWRRQKFVRDPHVPFCTLPSLTNCFLALSPKFLV